MKKLAVFVLVIFVLIFAIISFSKSVRNNATLRFRVMGTDVQITVKDRGAVNHIQAAFKSIKKVARLLDGHDSKSEISMINKLAGISGVKVEADTFSALEQALFVSRLTKGAFDITLKNYKNLKIDPFDKSVFIKERRVKIDMEGIGKGYAVEKARQTLLKRGVTSALIDMHSSMAVIGGPWRIGIKDPASKEGIVETIVLNNGEALSTSGNYEQGKHIMNTQTGKAAESCQSVTVIAKDAGFADALSTALYVMGPQKALSLVNSLEGVKVIVITSSGKVLKSWE